MKTILRASSVAVAIAMTMGIAHAASPTGEELLGQTVDVQFSDGTVNSVLFNADGTAVISAPGGLSASGTWSVADNQLCLNAGETRECWSYFDTFKAGQSRSMTSGCNSTSLWTMRAADEMDDEAEDEA